VASLNFPKYLKKFEKEVILKGVECGTLGNPILVSCRSVPFDTSRFARGMGEYLPYDVPMVIDYYGYYKKSRGFKKLIAEYDSKEEQLKLMSVPVVHFASLKMEEIAMLTDNVYLISKFVEFKQKVLEKRGFRG